MRLGPQEHEASGQDADGVPYWAFHRGADGPRTELVTRAVQPGLERYWATGTMG